VLALRRTPATYRELPVNGAAHDDWDGRILHKACWKDLKDSEKDSADQCSNGERDRSD
jgi:hypothetical protein